MPTKLIDHQFAAGALATFHAKLTVDYEYGTDDNGDVDRCKIQAGSIVTNPVITTNNPLIDVVSEQEREGPIHSVRKDDCVSSEGKLNHQDRVKCWYSGVVVLRTPGLKIPFTDIELPGIKLIETRFKLIIWINADGSTNHTIFENGQAI